MSRSSCRRSKWVTASTPPLPQIVADELGADWRTIAVEAAAHNAIYANTLFTLENSDGGTIAPDAEMVTGGLDVDPRIRSSPA